MNIYVYMCIEKSVEQYTVDCPHWLPWRGGNNNK